MIPWLAKADQSKVFPNNTTFDTPEQQEEVRRRLGVHDDACWCRRHSWRWCAAHFTLLPSSAACCFFRWPAH